MSFKQKIIKPNYMSNFKCISSKCEDTCGSGWQIPIDKESFYRYQDITNENKIDIFKDKIVKNDIITDDAVYAKTLMDEKNCCFLTKDKLCHIQKLYGKKYLSLTCDTFPRNYKIVNGTIETALNMSCPEAARIALLNPESMNFSEEVVDGDNLHIGKTPTLNSLDGEFFTKPYKFFYMIRNFIISLLQNRTYIFEDRIIILGLFCKELNELSDNFDNTIPELISTYIELVNNNGFSKLINSIPNTPTVQLKTLIILIEAKFKTGETSLRFTECFDEFKKGLNYSDKITDEELKNKYINVKSDYYDTFMREYEYIYENYFTNYVFKTLFPLGPQKKFYEGSLYMIPKTIFTEYVLLVLHFSIIKNMLIGISGYHTNKFGTEHILKLIQSFTKNIEHDVTYLKMLLNFFDNNNLMNFPYCVTLIKN